MTNHRIFQNCTSLGLALLIQSVTVIFGQLASSSGTNPQENRPTGSWLDYFPYHQTEELVHCQGVSDETSFWAVRTEQALFLYHESDNSLERLTTVEGMSGSNPTAIAWNGNSEILIVGYASGKLDLFSNTGEWLYTFNDIPQSNLIGDKSILNLLWGGDDNPDMIFAACGFGVVALNLSLIHISEPTRPY